MLWQRLRYPRRHPRNGGTEAACGTTKVDGERPIERRHWVPPMAVIDGD